MTKLTGSRLSRRGVRALACGLACVTQMCLLPAVAQEFPVKPVRVVVPYSAGGPVHMMARLHVRLQQALDDPETRTALEKLGLEPMKNSPEQADQLVLAESRRWNPIIKRLELKLE